MAAEEQKVEEEFNMKEEMIKLIVPIVFGIIAGAISYLITGPIRQRDPFGIIVMVIFIYLQKFVYPAFGIKIEAKDWASFGFLTLASWYISWVFLLNL